MTENILGNLFSTQSELMEHLSDYGMLTDEQITEKASQGDGIDAEYALTLFAERDFCKGVIDNIISEPSKSKLK